MQPIFEIQREKSNVIDIFERNNDSVCPHFHSNIELCYVLEGEMSITINGNTKKLCADELSIALSYDIHTYNTENTSKSIVLIVPVEYIKSFISISKGKNLTSPFMKCCSDSEEIKHCLSILYKNHDNINTLKSKGYIYVILSIIAEQIGFADKVKSDHFPREILIYIQENYMNKISLSDISERFGYNKYYFSKFFNTYFGYGLNEYINSLRARHAATLLLEAHQGIMEAAFNSGFDNQRTFNRAFQKTFGLSPSEYIKKSEC